MHSWTASPALQELSVSAKKKKKKTHTKQQMQKSGGKPQT